ncbi:MAG: MFS transporter [Gammaproteobacteria bacterium]|nr:MFS transporter [Gammaproteobacteria bacterium]
MSKTQPEADRAGASGADGSWRSLWLSSGAVSIGQLGDSLIYIVLPVNAETFGVTMAWVGVLLAANRLIRTVAYGFIARLGEVIGLRRLCILASLTAMASTAAYGLFEGWPALLAARGVWGLSYAALILAALGYAVAGPSRTGTRVGVSRAIEQVGPLLSLVGGTWLAGVLGVQSVFLALAALTVIALAFSMMLPEVAARPAASKGRVALIPKPNLIDLLIFWLGAGVDGVFIMTVTIMLADSVSIEAAMVTGGLIMAGRRIVEIVIAPISGVIADQFGIKRPLLVSSGVLIVGFGLVGVGHLLAGAMALVLARGALGTLFPAAVAHFSTEAAMQPLARNQTWRDLGAALGPLSTGFLLAVTSPESLHLALAVVYAVTLACLMRSRWWRTAADT